MIQIIPQLFHLKLFRFFFNNSSGNFVVMSSDNLDTTLLCIRSITLSPKLPSSSIQSISNSKFIFTFIPPINLIEKGVSPLWSGRLDCKVLYLKGRSRSLDPFNDLWGCRIRTYVPCNSTRSLTNTRRTPKY